MLRVPNIMKHVCAALVALAAVGAAGAAYAQQTPAAAAPTIKRNVLQKFDVPGTGYETFIGTAEVGPHTNIGRHSHFGPESGYMLEGEMTLFVDGQPARTMKAGESYQIPAGAIHDGRSGPQGAKVLATYVVEKGKPLATSAPYIKLPDLPGTKPTP